MCASSCPLTPFCSLTSKARKCKRLSEVRVWYAAHSRWGRTSICLMLVGPVVLAGLTIWLGTQVGREYVEVHLDWICLWSTIAQNEVLP